MPPKKNEASKNKHVTFKDDSEKITVSNISLLVLGRWY